MATRRMVEIADRLARLAVAVWLCSIGSLAAGAAELHDEIDRAIAAAAGGPLAGPASDGEFLRRASLTLAGEIPTADEARQFLADPAADKRAKLIDRLLDSPTYPRRLEAALSVMLLERRAGPLVPPQDWSTFLRTSLAANKPWNQLVRKSWPPTAAIR